MHALQVCVTLFTAYKAFSKAFKKPDERHLLQEVIGVNSEDIAYFYCSCDRSYPYPTIGAPGGFKFRDRFTGHRFESSEQMVRDFLRSYILKRSRARFVEPRIRQQRSWIFS